MAAPILVTKLYPPPLKAHLVERPSLIERLSAGLDRKAALISAPAGFGKSTLVSAWLDQLEQTTDVETAWLSLDRDDNDPAHFLTYLIAALGRTTLLGKDFGLGARTMLESPQAVPVETVLIPILNELADIPGKVVLVLDDLHLTDSQEVQDAISYLLDHLPPQLHLVLATRQDPQLPLGRLRAQGQVTELRAADLRFTIQEAAEFLNRLMGLDLSPEDIAELETRTEGWIAGLQLAAISMKGKEDIPGFIRSFRGTNRLVLDFLIEEVLSGLTPDLQDFLLRTSILERMTGPLCDALTGRKDGQQTLEALYNSNLFIIPLDEENCWYRYHHLINDLLRQRLNNKEPQSFQQLHALASDWYERNGYVEEAIEHAIHSQDHEQAADLIEAEIDDMWGREKHQKIIRWLNQLPSELVVTRPYLCIYFARLFAVSGRLDEAEGTLSSAEKALGVLNSRDNLPAIEPDEPSASRNSRKLTGRIAATRALMASLRSDGPSIMSYALQALRELPENDHYWRCSVTMMLGDSYVYQGHYADAVRTYLDAINAIRLIGNPYLLLNVGGRLAITQKSHGNLQQVLNTLPEQLEIAAQWGLAHTDLAGWLLAIWGDALAEAGDLDRALEKASAGARLVEHGTNIGNQMWSYLYLTRVLFSRGDWSAAEEIMVKTERIVHEAVGPLWVHHSIDSTRIRMWLSQGKLGQAEHWAQERGFNQEADPSYVDSIKDLALARIMIAQGKIADACTLLDGLLDAAETGGHVTRVIEISLLTAAAWAAGNQMDRSMEAMERALSLGKPNGYVQIFLDEGPPIAQLLYEALKRDIEPEHVQRLLRAFPVGQDSEGKAQPEDLSGLVEPLSEREIDVLELMADGLTNQRIAEQLFISPHTVKTHCRNIYAKLDVSNRTLAVGKSRALGILPAPQ